VPARPVPGGPGPVRPYSVVPKLQFRPSQHLSSRPVDHRVQDCFIGPQQGDIVELENPRNEPGRSSAMRAPDGLHQ